MDRQKAMWTGLGLAAVGVLWASWGHRDGARDSRGPDPLRDVRQD